MSAISIEVDGAALSLEAALEFIGDDECVEVTPSHVRLRKLILDGTARGRIRSNEKNA